MRSLPAILLILATLGELSSSARLQFGSFGIIPQRRVGEVHVEDILDAFSTSSRQWKPPAPKIKGIHVTSDIANRYANTLINSRIANPANVSQEVVFTVIIPETAFITGFAMEFEGKVYKAYVKEKEEAKREYTNAVNRGQAAAHVHQSARDSERFSVSVNVEAQSKVTFNLTYEQLLQRELGVYRHVVNLNPGEIIPEMKVDVHIKEMRTISRIRVNDITSANEIDVNVGENPKAQVELISPNEAKIHFEADEEEQKRLEKLKKSGEKVNGVSGQFVIEYDVERDPSGGEVIVNDGYFVHFFAPKDLPPLRKHVLFVLDTSGSMSGRKIEQLRQAMNAILDDLNPHDLFNIIEFSFSVTVRNLDAEVKSAVYQPFPLYSNNHYSDFVPEIPATVENTQPFPATKHYIERAKVIVDKMRAGGGTNIHDALKTAIEIAKRGVSNSMNPATDARGVKDVVAGPIEPELPISSSAEKEMASPENNVKGKEPPQPIIIFLTDGEPTVGETRLHKIQSAVNEFNGIPKATIFSLAFGEGADFPFLKKIALANNGFARHIYEAADAAQQLKNFYSQISSPLLANVKFVYPPGQVDDGTVTKRIFSNLFKGSELVISGKIGNDDLFKNSEIEAISVNGPVRYQIPLPELKPVQPHSYGSLERLWAYMTIRQLLDEQEVSSASKPQYPIFPDPAVASETMDNSTKASNNTKPTKLQPKEIALQIALKYSFVCPLTSLVVVKPNGTSKLNTESASPDLEDGPSAMPFQKFSGLTPALLHNSASRAPQMARYRISYDSPIMVNLNQASGNLRSIPPGSSNSGSRPHWGPRNSITPLDSSARQGFFGAPVHQKLNMLSRPSAVYSTTPFDRVDSADIIAPEESATESAIKDDLSSIPWIDHVRQGDTLVIHTIDGEKTLKLSPPVNYNESIPCSVEQMSGMCRPLHLCITDTIRNSVQDYIEHMCTLPEDYAGVCCLTATTPQVPVAETTQNPQLASTSSDDKNSTEDSTIMVEESLGTEPAATEISVEPTEVITENSTTEISDTSTNIPEESN